MIIDYLFWDFVLSSSSSPSSLSSNKSTNFPLGSRGSSVSRTKCTVMPGMNDPRARVYSILGTYETIWCVHIRVNHIVVRGTLMRTHRFTGGGQWRVGHSGQHSMGMLEPRKSSARLPVPSDRLLFCRFLTSPIGLDRNRWNTRSQSSAASASRSFLRFRSLSRGESQTSKKDGIFHIFRADAAISGEPRYSSWEKLRVAGDWRRVHSSGFQGLLRLVLFCRGDPH